MTFKMHDDELGTDVDLVRRLLQRQYPELADSPIVKVDSTGTSNALYRVGSPVRDGPELDLVVRLPLQPSEAEPIAKEHRWLPVLAPLLPVTIAQPYALGSPSDEFPLPWSIYPWLEGDDGIVARFDLARAAVDLASFIRALQAIDPTGGPSPSAANYGRGVPLADRDRYTRNALVASQHLLDDAALNALAKLWQRALETPVWAEPGRWIHGDIASGNLLFRDGRLVAVIDFAAMGVGDPACDLIVAWELFDSGSRAQFRMALDVDDATWERGRGWALSTAIGALYYYEKSNRFMFDQARRKLDAVLETESL